MPQSTEPYVEYTPSAGYPNRERIKNLCLSLWNSPTLTTWGRQMVSALRLFAVTPLLLTRLDHTELASWYLFGAVNLFGDLVFTRLQALFSRMIAIALGGATDLSPIMRPGEKRGDGSPNWPMIYRLYGTLGTIQLVFSFILTAIAFFIGETSLGHLLQDYPNPGTIWTTFYVFTLSSFLIYNFSKFGVALEGLNKLAVANRLHVLFDLLSLIAGAIALMLGGSILTLALVMQVFVLLGGLRGWLLLRMVDQGVMRNARGYGLDRQILAWAWPPAWKGFISQFASYGVVQMSGIILANHANAAMVASYLFALRIQSMLQQFAAAPFMSQIPFFSRLLSEGRLAELRDRMLRRTRSVLMLFGAMVLCTALLAGPMLWIIKSKTPFIPVESWLLLCFLTLGQLINQQAPAAAALGNNQLFYWEQSAAAIVTVSLLAFTGRFADVNGVIAMSFVPYLLILGLRPIKVGAKLLQITPRSMTVKALLWPVLGYISGSLVIVLIYQRLGHSYHLK
jgi:hypothetical protein